MQKFRIKSVPTLVILSDIKSGNFLSILVLPKKIKHWSLRSLLVKFIKIGTKIVRHSRYVMLQIAEVAIDERLFADILYRIERLRFYSV